MTGHLDRLPRRYHAFEREYRRRLLRHHAPAWTFGMPPELSPAGLAGLLELRSSVEVRGAPGTGKSTLLRHLCLLLAGPTPAGLRIGPASLPLYAPLPDFVRWGRGASDLPAYLARWSRVNLGLVGPIDFFEAVLESSSATVLLDDLGEVDAVADRRGVEHLVEHLAHRYPGCPFWVTSRHAVTSGEPRLDPARFPVLLLLSPPAAGRGAPAIEAGALVEPETPLESAARAALRDQAPDLRDALVRWARAPSRDERALAPLAALCQRDAATRAALRAELRRAWVEAPPAWAIACLHLHDRLLGAPEPALPARPDLPDLAPDLVAFADLPEVASMLGERASLRSFRAALSAGSVAPMFALSLDLALAPTPLASGEALRAALAWMIARLAGELRSRHLEGYPRYVRCGLAAPPARVTLREGRLDVILPGAPDAPPALGAYHRPPPLPEPWCPELRDQRLSGLSLAPRTEAALAAWLLASSPSDASTPAEAAAAAGRLLAFDLGRDFVRDYIAAFSCYFTGGFLDDFFVRDFFGDMAMPFVWDGCPGLVQRWTAPSDFLRASLLCHLFNAGCNAAAHAGDRARAESWLLEHPFQVFPVALAWEHLARDFAACRGRLAGAAGALMLVHAAYARVMTGIEAEAPAWRGLVEGRDAGDALVRLGYGLHELAHGRDVEEQVAAIGAMCSGEGRAAREVAEVLEEAGLREA